MRIGVPSEIKSDEYRVAITPAGVRELASRGHEVIVQAGAGEGSAMDDGQFAAQGARIVADAQAVFADAELVAEGEGAAGPEVERAARRAHAVHLPAPRGRAGARPRPHGARGRRASPTRPSRTRPGGCRCSRR